MVHSKIFLNYSERKYQIQELVNHFGQKWFLRLPTNFSKSIFDQNRNRI